MKKYKTRKKLKMENGRLRIKLFDLNADRQTAEDKLAEAEKLAEHQRHEIRELNAQLNAVEDVAESTLEEINGFKASMGCSDCDYITADGKKLCPQKCQSCRRGAKDRYEEADKPTTEANVISDDFLKSTEATT